MNQREGVYEAVSAVVGEINGKVELSDAQKKEVHNLVFAWFKAGEIEYKGGCPSDEQLKKYIPGLVNNWMRKDPNLNGGEKYVTKKPGSRAGSGDEQLKAMKALHSITTDPEAKEQIMQAIIARQEELKPVKVINVAALPPELRKFVKTA